MARSRVGRSSRIGPQDLPEVRAELVEAFGKKIARLDRLIAEAEDTGESVMPPRQLREIRAEAITWRAALEDGALWWVAEPMTEVAATAARTVPDEEATQLDEHADPSGLIYWAGSTGLTLPWRNAPAEHQTASAFGTLVPPQLPVAAMVWRTTDTIVQMAMLTDDARAVRVSPNPRRKLVEIDPEVASEEDKALQLDMLLRATHALALQPGLGERRQETAHTVGHGTPRRREPQQVTVVSLRRPASPSRQDDDAGAPSRHWTHQWVVGGHWRRQPVGKDRKERRLTWIAPHIKGPEGAPLILKEHVKVWNH
ncbi:hypothetical protein GCM10027059_09840 [Myceligenerans halotolerans]